VLCRGLSAQVLELVRSVFEKRELEARDETGPTLQLHRLFLGNPGEDGRCPGYCGI
jgi:hypothetical protein